MKRYRLKFTIGRWVIWKHVGPFWRRRVYCVFSDTCEWTARAVLRDLNRANRHA